MEDKLERIYQSRSSGWGLYRINALMTEIQEIGIKVKIRNGNNPI
jgi:hypothetical protein